jgi:hypothetical protein
LTPRFQNWIPVLAPSKYQLWNVSNARSVPTFRAHKPYGKTQTSLGIEQIAFHSAQSDEIYKFLGFAEPIPELRSNASPRRAAPGTTSKFHETRPPGANPRLNESQTLSFAALL